MKKTILLTVATLAMTGVAGAASITNKDAEARTVVVTEGGSRTEVSLAAGESMEICPNGCFLAMPNGDRVPLSGAETVEISNGAAVLR